MDVCADALPDMQGDAAAAWDAMFAVDQAVAGLVSEPSGKQRPCFRAGLGLLALGGVARNLVYATKLTPTSPHTGRPFDP